MSNSNRINNFSSRKDCVNWIEDLLGSTGTRSIAEKMFEIHCVDWSVFTKKDLTDDKIFWSLAEKAEKMLRNISLAEFKALKFEIQKIEVCTVTLHDDEYQHSEDETRKTYLHECYGIAIVACGEFKIEYQWDATSGNVQSYADAFEFKEIGINTSNVNGAVANFKIVTDDMYDNFEFDRLSAVFDELDLVSAIKAELPTLDEEKIVGKNDDENLEWFTIQRDDGPAYKFRGVIIGETESSDNNAHSSYSGSTGHSEKLALYKTQSGKFVCEKIGYSRWQGQRTRYSACVCDTVLDVGHFFGYGWLAKELYDDADLEIAIEV